MVETIEDSDDGQVANGQSRRDLQISLDAAELDTHFDVRHLPELTTASDRLKALRKTSAEDFHSPESLRCPSRNVVLDIPEGAGQAQAALMETVDNVGDFLRFVDWSNRSEISSGGCKHSAANEPRRAQPHPDRDRINNARLPWRRALTRIFRLARKAEKTQRSQRE
jgi:hypothetical protein